MKGVFLAFLIIVVVTVAFVDSQSIRDRFQQRRKLRELERQERTQQQSANSIDDNQRQSALSRLDCVRKCAADSRVGRSISAALQQGQNMLSQVTAPQSQAQPPMSMAGQQVNPDGQRMGGQPMGGQPMGVQSPMAVQQQFTE